MKYIWLNKQIVKQCNLEILHNNADNLTWYMALVELEQKTQKLLITNHVK